MQNNDQRQMKTMEGEQLTNETSPICCHSRSGSNLLADLMTRNGIGNLTDTMGNTSGEFLNKHFSQSLTSEERFKIISDLRTTNTANGVFAVKTSWEVFDEFKDELRPTRILFLKRRDPDRQAISHLLCAGNPPSTAEYWEKPSNAAEILAYQKHRNDKEFDPKRFKELQDYMLYSHRNFENFIESNPQVEVLRLIYEDDLASPDMQVRTVRKVAEFLKVSLTRSIQPTVRKKETDANNDRLMRDLEQYRKEHPGYQILHM